MNSIIQPNPDKCYLCGRIGSEPLDVHHVFFGPYREKSEKYGLKVYLHHSTCHIFGPEAVHTNAENCRMIQREVQIKAMQRYGWSENEFRKLFGRSYKSD